MRKSNPFALAGTLVAEIVQGLRRDVRRIEHFLSLWEMFEPAGFSTDREASSISRLAHWKGISLTTIDSFLAAIALESYATLFRLDKDFSRLAPLTLLR